MRSHVIKDLLVALESHWAKYGPDRIRFGRCETDNIIIYFRVDDKDAFAIRRKSNGDIIVWYCLALPASEQWLSWKVISHELICNYDNLMSEIEEYFLVRDINDKLKSSKLHSQGPYR